MLIKIIDISELLLMGDRMKFACGDYDLSHLSKTIFLYKKVDESSFFRYNFHAYFTEPWGQSSIGSCAFDAFLFIDEMWIESIKHIMLSFLKYIFTAWLNNKIIFRSLGKYVTNVFLFKKFLWLCCQLCNKNIILNSSFIFLCIQN